MRHLVAALRPNPRQPCAWRRACVDSPESTAAASTVAARSCGRPRALLTATALLAALVALSGSPAGAQVPPGPGVPLPAVTELLSVSSSGQAGDNDSFEPSVNGPARLVAFTSRAANLVLDDTNGAKKDVFARNPGAHTTSLVSVSTSEVQGNSDSEAPSISADGLRVAFTSFGDNLVPADTNDSDDVFVRDLGAGTTLRISIPGALGQANDDSTNPSISADGRWVAFSSHADNLVPVDTNGTLDVFVRDLQNFSTERVSLSSAEVQGNDRSVLPAISGDGRYVAFVSEASNLVPGDTNDPTPGQIGGGDDVFVRDRVAGRTTRVNVRSNGNQTAGDVSSPAISADGRWVAFSSRATNLLGNDLNGNDADVFLHDRVSRATTLVSRSSSGVQANDSSERPSLSADGRYIAFDSNATNLVPGDTNGLADVFRRDRVTDSTGRFSLTTEGDQAAPGGSVDPSISADGSKVAFRSSATNLSPNDGPLTIDVFLRRPDPDPLEP
jgi:Tol biopolymer transport system component